MLLGNMAHVVRLWWYIGLYLSRCSKATKVDSGKRLNCWTIHHKQDRGEGKIHYTHIGVHNQITTEWGNVWQEYHCIHFKVMQEKNRSEVKKIKYLKSKPVHDKTLILSIIHHLDMFLELANFGHEPPRESLNHVFLARGNTKVRVWQHVAQHYLLFMRETMTLSILGVKPDTCFG